MLAENADFKLIIMSATPSAASLLRRFPEAAVVQVAGSSPYPVEVHYRTEQELLDLDQTVADQICDLIEDEQVDQYG